MNDLTKEDSRIILRALRNARSMAYGFNFPATQGEVDQTIKRVKAILKEIKE